MYIQIYCELIWTGVANVDMESPYQPTLEFFSENRKNNKETATTTCYLHQDLVAAKDGCNYT